MADNTEYSKKHPDYSESYQRRGLALDLYEGGRRVEENPAYLIRHPYETQLRGPHRGRVRQLHQRGEAPARIARQA